MIHYIAAQSYLTDKQMDTIDKETMAGLYPGSGYNCNMSRAVLQALIDMGGTGFTPMKVAAKSGYIQHFLKNWRTPREELGKFLRIVYSWAVESAGVSFPLL